MNIQNNALYKLMQKNRKTLIISVLLLCLIFVTPAIVAFNQIYSKDVIGETAATFAEQYLHEISAQTTAHISDNLTAEFSDLEALANYLQKEQNLTAKKYTELLKQKENTENCVLLAFVDTEGCYHDKNGIHSPGGIIGFFNRLINGDTNIVTYNHTTDFGKMIVLGTAVEPIKFGEYTLCAAIIGFKTADFSNQMSLTDNHSDYITDIVSQKGNFVLKNTEENRLYSDCNLISFLKRQTNVTAEEFQQISEGLGSTTDNDGYITFTDKNNESYYLHYAPIPNTNWMAITTLNTNQIKAPIQLMKTKFTRLFWVLVSAFVLMLAVILFSFFNYKNNQRDKIRFTTDPLTGLPNLQAFSDEVLTVLRENPNQRFVICRFDIDHFKLFNDTFGMKAGDKLLRKIGESALSALQNKADFLAVGYLGTDHFVSLRPLEGIDPDEEHHKIITNLKTLVPNYTFSVHLGYCIIDGEKPDIARICDRALMAIASIKTEEDIHWAWFDESMRQNLLNEREITSFMHEALSENQFIPYFQPQYDYASRTICGTEALVRWKHPEKGLIPPGVFLPIMEKNGFVFEMDKCVWRQVMSHIRKWKDQGLTLPSFSVNISRRDISHEDLTDTLVALIREYGLSPHDVHLEITESAYIENQTILRNTVNRLKECGFIVEMDDFGSGYSSLSILKDLPFDIVKLDLNFLVHSDADSKGNKILSAIVPLMQNLDLQVIAEGVEEKEQADFLLNTGCNHMQGYYFSRPIPAEQYEKLLRNDNEQKQ